MQKMLNEASDHWLVSNFIPMNSKKFGFQKEDPRKFFFIKKFYLRVAYLMIHNQMSHNQAKNWVLSLIYRAAIDFKKSKKN